ncbi:MAG: MDR family MFS transporter [Solirubrobacteraceae bacterium]|nr:MDR family MFS transporter [Solirubrobacteraceae bacterium]
MSSKATGGTATPPNAPKNPPVDHAAAEDSGMSHRQILEAMSGLMLGMFVAILSSTVVSTSLPIIVSDLGGSQSAYTWVVTSTLLALTVSTPVWGKLADLYNRKTLVQVGLVIYTTASIFAGLSQNMEQLIFFRVIQGIGVGAMTSLVQVILSDLVSARERGRYSGYLGAVFGVGTVVGPLLGGLLTDGLGWRACFYVGVPFSVAAFIVLQRTLKLPRRPRGEVHMDYLGILTIAGSVSALLIWVSLAGHQFDWLSVQTAILVPLGLLLGVLAVAVERRARQPLVPLRLFGERTVVLSVIASISVGIAMFGTTVFLSQYLQLARGMTPTESGLLSIPMVFGLFLSSTIIGRKVSATGRYKKWMLVGATMLTVGLALMGTLDERTSLIELGAFMLIIGGGVGMLMQNLVLIVQNSVSAQDMGSGSSLIAFFRSLGGATGVSVLGAVLATQAASSIKDGLAEAGASSAGGALSSGKVPDLSTLPEPVVRIVEHAYGIGVGDIFLVATPLSLIALIAVAFLKEVPLGTKSGLDLAREGASTQANDPTGDAPAAPADRPTAGVA